MTVVDVDFAAHAKRFEWLDFHHRLDGCIYRDLFVAVCPKTDEDAAKRYMQAKGYQFFPVDEADWDDRDPEEA